MVFLICFRLRLEWKVFQLLDSVVVDNTTGCFRLRLEWKVFQQEAGQCVLVASKVSVSVWSGRYFN